VSVPLIGEDIRSLELGAAGSSARPGFVYWAFGLNIRSEIECHGVLPGAGPPDVHVRLGRVKEELESAGATGILYQAKPGQLLLNVNGVARYLISAGNEIVIDVAPGADPGMVLLLLFGSAFGALLYQRGVLSLHGSAIVTPLGAVVFAGASGHGKSTLAGAFHRRGFEVIADDVCPISTGHLPTVLPANPFLMLWADAADYLGIDQRQLRRARLGLQKYILPLGDRFAAEPVRLHAVYVLEPSNRDNFTLVPIRGIEKFNNLILTSYRPQFAHGMNLGRRHFEQIGKVAQQARVAVVKRPDRGLRVEELADLLEADFET
jgi:hypothetical protein